MNPQLQDILLISRDTPLSPDELARLEQQYPAFTLPRLMALKAHCAGADDAARVAISLPDLDSLRDILGEEADSLANFYPTPLPETPSTMQTIDTFLATYGTPADARETEALTKAIFNPRPDYTAVLAAEERDSIPEGDELDATVVGEQTAAINRFIAASKSAPEKPKKTTEDTPEATSEAKPEAKASTPQPTEKRIEMPSEKSSQIQAKPAESGNLSESFARIMIKNHNYTKALEIISDLSLKNPEKSIYFADQIRFLRKLIANDNRNNKKQ